MKSTFKNIKNEIFERLKQKLNISSNDALNNSVIGHLSYAISSLYDNNIEYLEDALTEQNKYSAQRKKSIFALASQSGYEPSYGTSQQVTIGINVKTNNINTGKISLNNHCKFLCTNNGLYYTLQLPFTDSDSYLIPLTGDHRTHNFTLYQGTFNTQTFSYDPIRPTYSIHLEHYGNIDTTKLNIYFPNIPENGSGFNNRYINEYEVDSSNFSGSGIGYVVKYSPRGGMDIIFINDNTDYYSGLTKDQTVPYSEITVEYITHDGDIPNTLENLNFILVDSVYDTQTGEEYNGNEFLNISTLSVIPGTGSDTTEKVRSLIGYNSRTNVLTMANHYKAFLSRFGCVGYSKTWSDPNSMRVHSRIIKNYKSASKPTHYFRLSENDFILSQTEKQEIKNALINSGLMLAGTEYDILDTEVVKYALYVYVKLKKGSVNYNTTSNNLLLKTYIVNILSQYFYNTEIDGFISKSELINEVYNKLNSQYSINNSIDSLDIYILSHQNEQAKINGFYYDKKFIYHPIQGYTFQGNPVKVIYDENSTSNIKPLGLDIHGNIDTTDKPYQLPIVSGGWSWKNDSGQLIYINPEEPIMVEIE